MTSSTELASPRIYPRASWISFPGEMLSKTAVHPKPCAGKRARLTSCDNLDLSHGAACSREIRLWSFVHAKIWLSGMLHANSNPKFTFCCEIYVNECSYALNWRAFTIVVEDFMRRKLRRCPIASLKVISGYTGLISICSLLAGYTSEVE